MSKAGNQSVRAVVTWAIVRSAVITLLLAAEFATARTGLSSDIFLRDPLAVWREWWYGSVANGWDPVAAVFSAVLIPASLFLGVAVVLGSDGFEPWRDLAYQVLTMALAVLAVTCAAFAWSLVPLLWAAWSVWGLTLAIVAALTCSGLMALTDLRLELTRGLAALHQDIARLESLQRQLAGDGARRTGPASSLPVAWFLTSVVGPAFAALGFVSASYDQRPFWIGLIVLLLALSAVLARSRRGRATTRSDLAVHPVTLLATAPVPLALLTMWLIDPAETTARPAPWYLLAVPGLVCVGAHFLLRRCDVWFRWSRGWWLAGLGLVSAQLVFWPLLVAWGESSLPATRALAYVELVCLAVVSLGIAAGGVLSWLASMDAGSLRISRLRILDADLTRLRFALAARRRPRDARCATASARSRPGRRFVHL
nr:hypothetical protein [Propionicimonas sp.]